MARLARVVVPGIPHHITQRGNRRQRVFFGNRDYALYRRLLGEHAKRSSVQIWAYCLMPNHVHVIMVPHEADGLYRSLAEAHRRYTLHINAREGWRGYLWQGRFASFPMDETHLLAAARYVELNPVRAGLCAAPEEWPWSSARAHLAGRDDELAQVTPLLSLVGAWRAYLSRGSESREQETLRRHARTGRPLGSEAFIESLERVTGRRLKPRRPGPRPRSRDDSGTDGGSVMCPSN